MQRLAQQRAWWDGFVDDFIVLLGDAESRLTDAWAEPPGWLSWMWDCTVGRSGADGRHCCRDAAWTDALGGFQCPFAHGRAGCWGCWGFGGTRSHLTSSVLGGSRYAVAQYLAGDVSSLVACHDADGRPAFGYRRRVVAGRSVSSFAALIFEGWWSKLLAIVCGSGGADGCRVALYGVSIGAFGLSPTPLSHSRRRPRRCLPSTNTPVPPTATATPIVDYWPVQPGTPVPTPSGAFGVDAQQLGCYQDSESPIVALRVIDGTINALGATTTSQRDALTLEGRGSTANALSVEVYALSPDP